MPFKVSDKYYGFIFDGYNGILEEYGLDNLVGEKYCQHYNLQFVRLPIVVEGGALVGNENNCILTNSNDDIE